VFAIVKSLFAISLALPTKFTSPKIRVQEKCKISGLTDKDYVSLYGRSSRNKTFAKFEPFKTPKEFLRKIGIKQS